MNSDLQKYRNCVEHLSDELQSLKNDELRFEDNVNRSRHELSNIQTHLINNIHTLQNESDLLYSLILNELTTQTNQPISENMIINSVNSKKKLIEMSINQLEEYDQQILQHVQQGNSDENDAAASETTKSESTRHNKRKNIEVESNNFYCFQPSIEETTLTLQENENQESHQNGNNNDNHNNHDKNDNVNEDAENHDLDSNILINFVSMIELLDYWKRTGIANEENFEPKYNKFIQDLNLLHPHLTATSSTSSTSTSSKHSNCLDGEMESLYFELSTFPEHDIKSHLRQYLYPDITSPSSANEQIEENQLINDQNTNQIRGTRRKKTSSVTTRSQHNISQLQLTALRRTPQNQPLFLTPISSFEDSFGGVLTQFTSPSTEISSKPSSKPSISQIATVENLLLQEIESMNSNIIPIEIKTQESQLIRLNNLKASLQRGIRTLNALEKEKAEWTAQTEKLSQNSNRDIIESALPGTIFNRQMIVTTTEKNENKFKVTNSTTTTGTATTTTSATTTTTSTTNNNSHNSQNTKNQNNNNSSNNSNQLESSSHNGVTVIENPQNNNNNTTTTNVPDNLRGGRWRNKNRASEGGNTTTTTTNTTSKNLQNEQMTNVQTATTETSNSTNSAVTAIAQTDLSETVEESPVNTTANGKETSNNKKSKKVANLKKKK